MSTKLDMVKVMSFQRPGYALSGRYDVVLPNLIMATKNPLGYPVDVLRYDNNFIYDQQTEVNWTDPDYVKLHLANGGRGMLVSQRYMDPAHDFPSQPLVTPDAPFIFVKGCKWDYQIHTVGQTRSVWSIPTMMSWGGDVKGAKGEPAVLTYIRNYYWSDPKDREQFLYVPGTGNGGTAIQDFGLVKWNHGVLQPNGGYKLDNDPPASNKLQTLADWQKNPDPRYHGLTSFTYKIPFKSPTNF